MKSEKSLTKRLMPLLVVLLTMAVLVAVIVPTLAYYIRSGGKVENEYTPAKPNIPTPNFTLNPEKPEMTNVRIQVEDNGYPVYVRVSIVVTWQTLADCTCTISKACICQGCDGCGEDGKTCSCDDECLEDCPFCAECLCDECEGCDDGEDCSCEECKDCIKCAEPEPCETCKQEERGELCEECTDCLGCEECPWCNEDPDDDVDIVYVVPVIDQDYTMDLNVQEWTELDGFYYCTSPVLSGEESPVLLFSCALGESADMPSIGKNCFLNVEIIVQTVQAIGFTDKDEAGKEYPAWQDAWGNAPY